MIDLLFWILLIPNAITFSVVLYNYFTAPRLIYDNNENETDEELVSILIPARNEEQNISFCLDSICTQTYKNLEILVLDDQSTDNTAEIVKDISKKDSRVKLVCGLPLPDGWLGKNWACHNLSIHANSEKLLFIDADVRLSEEAVRLALNKMRVEKASMLSVFPTQKIENLGTYLITPMMNWILLMFLPLRKVLTSNNKSFIAANGQFILVRKKDYLSIGGHEKVKAKVVEDMELAKLMKLQRKRVITLIGDSTVYCKMYARFAEAFYGFSKNFFAGFDVSYLAFSLLLILLLLIYLVPFLLFFVGFKYAIIVMLALLSRTLIAIMSKQSTLFAIFMHPIQMIILFILGINSMIVTKKKRARWKGRFI